MPWRLESVLQILLPLRAKTTTSKENQVLFGTACKDNSIENRFHVLSMLAAPTKRADESPPNFDTPTQGDPKSLMVFDEDISSGADSAILSDNAIGEQIELSLHLRK